MNYAHDIKNAVTMRQVCDTYGLEVNRAGFTSCPFHGTDSTPSLKIYPGNRGFCCFGCHKAGDVIDFVRLYFNLSFREAQKKLNDDFALGLPIDGEISDRKLKQAKAKAERWEQKRKQEKEHHQRLLNAYQSALDVYSGIESTIRDKAPQNPHEEPSEEYLQALMELEPAKYRLAETESALMAYEHAKNNR